MAAIPNGTFNSVTRQGQSEHRHGANANGNQQKRFGRTSHIMLKLAGGNGALADTAFFANAGKKPGLEIWRVEKLKLVPVPLTEYGKLYTYDAYVVLFTCPRERYQYHIHFWQGEACSPDETTVAAYKVVELGICLGSPWILEYREVQGHETEQFMSYFKTGLRYLEGSMATEMDRDAEPDGPVRRLYRVSGTHNCRATQVEFSVYSLNQSGVFLLDAGWNIYLWVGPKSSQRERVKAAELSCQLRDDEHRGQAYVHVVEQTWDSDEQFFSEFGDSGPFRGIKESDEQCAIDWRHERREIDDIKLFKVLDKCGKLEARDVRARPLSRKMMDSTDSYILDLGNAGVFAWVGKQCPTADTIEIWKLSLEYLRLQDYPSWTPICRVRDGSEPSTFKQAFQVWLDPKGVSESPVKGLNECCGGRIKARDYVPDDGTGEVQIWRVENFYMAPVEKTQYGRFYSGDCYVILYRYMDKEKERGIVYFWQGANSNAEERAACIAMAGKVDAKETNGQAVLPEDTVAIGNSPRTWTKTRRKKKKQEKTNKEARTMLLIHRRGKKEKPLIPQSEDGSRRRGSGSTPALVVDTFGEFRGGVNAGAAGSAGADGPFTVSSSTSSSGAHQTTIRVRSKFPETWIWWDSVIKSDGKVTYQTTVPDTITSWITSAFAVSESAGLGVAPEPVKLEVFRPFFVRLDLPYSIKRGEKVALQVLAFNYMPKEQKVTITLDNGQNGSFEFIQKPGLTKGKQTSKQLNVRQVTVPGGGGSAATYFPIIARTVGVIKLLVTAIGSSGSDAVEMPLIVEPEGFPIYKTVPFVLELAKGNKTSKSVNLDIPKEIVPGSARAEFTVNGDIMAPILNNIEQLVQMPTGCGEQNMLSFVPDIVVTQYLKTTQRLTPAFEEKAKGYMESGYQRELTYQRSDASYSAFGKSDPNGSTWLTAFVTRSFKQAKQFIFIDSDKLKQSIKYLRSQQKQNGVYEEHGMVHHKAMQGGASQGGVALTAYVLLALIENGENDPAGLSFLERSLDRIKSDAYACSIVAYALHLAKSSKRDDAYKQLESLAINSDGQKHWSYVVRDDLESKEPSWWEAPRPVDVETTAYALLTYVIRGNTQGALPIVRWLVSKRSAFGGYSSTQDTVVALQALSAYASKVFSKNTDISLTVSNGDRKESFTINPANAIVLQSVLLNQLDKPIQLAATGQGIAYSQINYHYNVPKRADPQPFQCKKSVKQSESGDITVDLCCNYALKGRSNMVVIEAAALSGYVIDEYELNKLIAVKDLQRVEVTKGGTVANIYINSLGSTPLCLNVTSNRGYQVGDQKPALIVVYDYYAPGQRIEFEYSASKQSSFEELCGNDCWGDDGGKAAGAPSPPKQPTPPKGSPVAGNNSPKNNNSTKTG